MASQLSQDPKSTRIREWQANVETILVGYDDDLVQHSFRKCVAASRLIASHLSRREDTSRQESRRFSTSLERLVMWGKDYSIDSGGLDGVLGHSSIVRRSILEAFGEIGTIIGRRLFPRMERELSGFAFDQDSLRVLVSECKEALSRCDDLSETSLALEDEEGVDESRPDSISEMIKDFTSEVNILVDLEILMNLPSSFHDDKVARPSATREISPEKIFSDLIALRYPKASAALVRRLGKANWKRFQHGTSQRQMRAQEAPVPRQHKGECENVVGESHTVGDSGYGTEERTIAYAETIMSYSRNDDYTVRIPGLPKQVPFECVCCGRWLHCRDKKVWKQHLMADLLPWICLNTDCPVESPMPRKDDWIAHLATDHSYAPDWVGETCPLCCEQTKSGKGAIIRHISSHLEEISLAALPAYAESESDFASSDGDVPGLHTLRKNRHDLGDLSGDDKVPFSKLGTNQQPETTRDVLVKIADSAKGKSHGEIVKPKPSEAVPKSRKAPKPGGFKFSCSYEGCGKSFSRADHFYRHQLNHNLKEVFACDWPDCSRTFIGKELMIRHRQRHDDARKINYTPRLPVSDATQPDLNTQAVPSEYQPTVWPSSGKHRGPWTYEPAP